jgi:hypothetical protein
MLLRRQSWIGFVVLFGCGIAYADDDPRAVEHFESKIRPVLVEHCQSCHSAEAVAIKKLRGGLLLDTKAGWMKGGDSGKVIVPGKPGESLLVKSLHYADELQMPPKGKLPAAVIADFEKWISDGAVDPRVDSKTSKTTGIDLKKGREHWAYQPPKATTGSTVDSLIKAKWDERKLKPVAKADRRTLLRRATFDLTGLPPTAEEVEAFEKDQSADAWDKVIERLLASPRYGERWGRHWLDVARYAEDQAHTFEVKPKANAYVYRDWVIQAFNNDMPYDTFVRLQLAGDLVAESVGDKSTRIAALGLLGLGANYYKNTAREQAIAEELDDRVDVVTRAFLGLTVSCARCHDHKFDPIPTRDYYSIAGIYYGTNLTDTPIVPDSEVKAYAEGQAKVKEQEDIVAGLFNRVGRNAVIEAIPLTAKYIIAARDVKAGRSKLDEKAKADGLNRYFLDRWMKFLDPANVEKMPATIKAVLTLKANATEQEVRAAAEAVQVALQKLDVPNVATTGKKSDAKAKSNDPLIKAVFQDQTAPLLVNAADAEKLFLTQDDRQELDKHRVELEKRKKALPQPPIQAPVISGSGQGMKVYIRGNPATKGEDAPKGFLQVLGSASSKSGKDYTRLDLADAIATRDNPLTARVMVNRVWAWHFGRGLVATPSNFGLLGDRPSHPELLDHLAAKFMDHGWSIKWLHRQVMKSSAYQLSSESDTTNSKTDAANVYLWQSGRKRLDVESWRDSLLSVSGQLDGTIGGPTFDLKDPSARRRTVYAKVSRHELDGLLRLFDFPDANVTADKRNSTTVPQQQLFALNSEFMLNQARAFATRLEKINGSDADRIHAAYKLAFQRPADSQEVEIGMRFLNLPNRKEDKLTRWQQYAQAILASNEFLYVD